MNQRAVKRLENPKPCDTIYKMAKKVGMIVDDEPDIIQHVSSIISSEGFEIISCRKGRDAVKLADEKQPDFILLDIFLDDIDGGEVANQLSQNPRTENIPVIYLTGLVTKEEQKEVGKTGKHYVIAKPVLKSELIEMINKVLA